ncbi:MAG: alcohol dehydrogenase [Phycisphaeraceae bacterium]|nr:alcohol dehydrogenase [Phycisphaeraceae bacterium]|tara:strand:+ start:582 stop:1565 length:984 start_codon:yes stop_codon:yes gene_type:complete
MRAVTATDFGGTDVLELCDVHMPIPGDQDLLVEVHSAAVNPVDFKIRRGAFRDRSQLPMVLGFDASGVVCAMGQRVEGFKSGDEIYVSPSLVRNGSNAEYVCVDARTAARKPRCVDHMTASAMPLATLTAWEALYERTSLERNETVLIHAGGGGVGHIAIQLAKLKGARVLITASRDESIELCLGYGADVVINYVEEDFVKRVLELTNGRGCDVVFDCVGGEVFDRSPACVAVNGRIVTIVGSSESSALRDLFVRNITLHFEMMAAPTMYNINPQKQGQILHEAAKLVDDGKLAVHISQAFPLVELAEAHQLQETEHVTGKIAIQVR